MSARTSADSRCARNESRRAEFVGEQLFITTPLEGRYNMHASKPLADAHSERAAGSPTEGPLSSISRRSFLATGLAVGAGATLGPLGRTVTAFANDGRGALTEGDAAILRFLSAAEILETDLWQQYNELGGVQDTEVPGGTGNKTYIEALEKLDEDMPQYIHDNTEDEFTHFTFINA